MSLKTSSLSGIEALARAALIAAYPRAVFTSRRPRPQDERDLPCILVTVSETRSEYLGMGVLTRMVEGELTVEIFLRSKTEVDRFALPGLADHVRATLIADLDLRGYLAASDAAPGVIEVEAEVDTFARLEVSFAVTWIEDATPPAIDLSAFGLN